MMFVLHVSRRRYVRPKFVLTQGHAAAVAVQMSAYKERHPFQTNIAMSIAVSAAQI